MELDLEDLSEKSSDRIHGFTDLLTRTLPGLNVHTCSRGYRGGFVERLREGTYPGHIVEHVALELSELAGIGATYGKTVRGNGPTVYKVVVRYLAEQAMSYLLRAAVKVVEQIIDGKRPDIAPIVNEAKRIAGETELGPSTLAILKAAEARDIPWRRLNDDSLVQLGYGSYRRIVQAAVTDKTSLVASDIVADKELTKQILAELSIPVPKGYMVYTEAEAVDAFNKIGGAVAMKPLRGHHGQGVTLEIRSEDEVRSAYWTARDYDSAVLVEEYFSGRDYRVLVVGDKVVAAAEKVPAHVVGDGIHTIRELVDIANHDPARGEGHEKPLTKIRLDSISTKILKQQDLTPDSVPTFGQKILLRRNANISTGGIARDVTDFVHPEIAQLCVRAVGAVGLDVCGIDIVLQDIELPLLMNRGGIIELNAGPGLRMHMWPTEGKSREVGGAIVEMLYPKETPSRIPIIAITGTNGKTTVARLTAHLFSNEGRCVGLASTDGIFIDGRLAVKGDMTGPRSARTVLSDKRVEVAVLETARGGIIRGGLGYDWSDMAILTNIQADHIGQDGIETIEDIVHVKSLVAERVRKGGTLILNADDPNLAALPEVSRVGRTPKNVVYFSMSKNNPVISAHEGVTYYVHKGRIYEDTGAGTRARAIVSVADVPITLRGTAAFQIANLMAAIAAARSMGIEIENIVTALQTFESGANNSGRVNLYRVKEGFVLVDYGHNPAAIEAVSDMLKRWNGYKLTAVLGLPGDRADWVLMESAKAAARNFSKIIVKEDRDLRGRKPGETARLICQTVREVNGQVPCEVVENERDAVHRAIDELEPHEIVVVFYDQINPVLSVLKQSGAVRLAGLPGSAEAAGPRFREAPALM